MKKIYSVLFLACICNIAIAQIKPSTTTPAQKQTTPKTTTATPKSAIMSEPVQMSEADMKAWGAYMTPGSMHKMLAKFDGLWKEEVTIWMTPGAPPSSSIASCTNQMVMDGRYQESIHSGDMSGMAFEGRGYVGYDNAKNVFVSTWFDNMGTGIMFMEGKWDEATKTIHFKGTSVDPKTGKDLKVREEFKIIDDNNHLLQMYMTQEGKEHKTMEIKFMR